MAESSGSFPLFLDSSLDTHLAMLVSHDDTVADLKGKFELEHVVCFPDVGEIVVRAVKVKRKGSLYHLSDSMLVRSALDGMKGTRFLHVEAVPASEAKRRTAHGENSNKELVGYFEGRVQDVVKNALLDERGVALNEMPHLEGEQTLPGTIQHGLSGDAINNSELDKKRHEVESNADLVVDQGKVDHGEGEGQDPSVRDDYGNNDVVAIKKEKYRKGRDVSQSDQMEKETRVEECENIGVEANDRSASVIGTKEGKSGSKNEVSQEAHMLGRDSGFVSLEKKKRKKMKISSSDIPAKDPLAGSNSLNREETSKLGGIIREASIHEEHESNLASEKEVSVLPPDRDSLLLENQNNDEKRRKRRRHSSKSSKEVDSSDPSNAIDPSLGSDKTKPDLKKTMNDNLQGNSEAIDSVAEQIITGNSEEAGRNSHKDLSKESDAAIVSDEPDLNVTTDASSTKYSGPDDQTGYFSGDKLSNDVLKKDLPVHSIGKEATLNCEDISDANNSKPSEESNDTRVLKEDVHPRNPVEVGPEVPIKLLGRKKKSKNEISKTARSKFDPYNSLENVAEGNTKEKPENISDAMSLRASNDATDNKDSTKVYFEVPSDGNIKITSHKRRKSSGKRLHSNDHEAINSSSGQHDQVTEVDKRQKGQNQEPEVADGFKEASTQRDSAIVGSGNPSDAKSRRRRKKSSKVELQNQDSTQQELANSLEEENLNMRQENNQKIVEQNVVASNGSESVCIQSLAEIGNRDSSSCHHKKLARPELSCDTCNLVNSLGSKDTQDDKAYSGTVGDSGKMIQENGKEPLGSNIGYSAKEASLAGNETNDLMALHNSDDRIKFINFFLPKEVPESFTSAKELPGKEAETVKPHKEKTKSKRKPNTHSQVSTPYLVNSSDDQPVFDGKTHNIDVDTHDLVDSMASREPNSKKAGKEKAAKRSSRPNVDQGNNPCSLMSPHKSHDGKRLDIEPQKLRSDTNDETNLSRSQQRKHMKSKEKISVSESKHKHLKYQGGTASIDSRKEDQLMDNANNFVQNFPVSGPLSQNKSGTHSDPSQKEAISNIAASSDSTEDTPYQTRRYKVAVRKIPSRRVGEFLNTYAKEKISLASSGTIFNDATSGSSDDESDIINKKDAVEADSDNSSTSADSDRDLDDHEIQKIGITSAVYDKKDKGTGDGSAILSQSSSGPRKKLPLDTILRSSSSYKKAKLTASQSQADDDSENQPIDVVPETQPEFGSI
ncbi:uncharacterized protein [Typha angustifolia]|uniref:uncharacterized protein n=1 Tax=Typha angustifolia TaxID=59011 RepID=UPI003C2D8F2F